MEKFCHHPVRKGGIGANKENPKQSQHINTAFKPVRTLDTVLKKPKDRPPLVACKGTVYKSDCKSCDFTYVENQKAPGIHAGLNTSQGRAAEMTHS